jgi:hypothetical protein
MANFSVRGTLLALVVGGIALAVTGYLAFFAAIYLGVFAPHGATTSGWRPFAALVAILASPVLSAWLAIRCYRSASVASLRKSEA